MKKSTKCRQFDRQLCLSDGKYRQLRIASVDSTLKHVDPRSKTGMADLLTTTLIDAVEADVPPPPRRQRKRGWCGPAETSVAFKITWSIRVVARQLLRANPRGRITWKTLRTARANLQEVIAAGVHVYLEEYLAETPRLLMNNDQRASYKHQ